MMKRDRGASWEEPSLLTPPREPEWRLVAVRDRHGKLRQVAAHQVAAPPLTGPQRSSDWMAVIAAVETGY